MPSNKIQINNHNKLTWEVGDSKMDDLIVYLNEVGYQEKEGEDREELPTGRGRSS